MSRALVRGTWKPYLFVANVRSSQFEWVHRSEFEWISYQYQLAITKPVPVSSVSRHRIIPKATSAAATKVTTYRKRYPGQGPGGGGASNHPKSQQRPISKCIAPSTTELLTAASAAIGPQKHTPVMGLMAIVKSLDFVRGSVESLSVGGVVVFSAVVVRCN